MVLTSSRQTVKQEYLDISLLVYARKGESKEYSMSRNSGYRLRSVMRWWAVIFPKVLPEMSPQFRGLERHPLKVETHVRIVQGTLFIWRSI
jgi:hypothetical protein